MDAVEFALKILPFNDTLPQELTKLEAEGWQAIPNLAPAVSYVMYRPAQVVQPAPRPAPEVSGAFKMAIDDSKVTVVRSGKEAVNARK
jgi:hypothetical protein